MSNSNNNDTPLDSTEVSPAAAATGVWKHKTRRPLCHCNSTPRYQQNGVRRYRYRYALTQIPPLTPPQVLQALKDAQAARSAAEAACIKVGDRRRIESAATAAMEEEVFTLRTVRGGMGWEATLCATLTHATACIQCNCTQEAEGQLERARQAEAVASVAQARAAAAERELASVRRLLEGLQHDHREAVQRVATLDKLVYGRLKVGRGGGGGGEGAEGVAAVD